MKKELTDQEKDISRAIGLLRTLGKPDEYLENKYRYLLDQVETLSGQHLIKKYYDVKKDEVLGDKFVCKKDGYVANYFSGALIHAKKEHYIYVKRKG